MGVVLPFPGQEETVKALTEEETKQTWDDFHFIHVGPFCGQADELLSLEGDEFYERVHQLRNILTSWLSDAPTSE